MIYGPNPKPETRKTDKFGLFGFGFGSVSVNGFKMPSPNSDTIILLRHFFFCLCYTLLSLPTGSVTDSSLAYVAKKKSSGTDSGEENMSKKDLALHQAIDQITSAFGKGAIMWLGRSQDL